jgi:predicted aspartyl protease
MKTILPLVISSIENDGFHLRLKIIINGKEANLILDTGASKTVFDEEKIVPFLGHNDLEEEERLSTGLGTTTMKSKSVIIDKIELNELVIQNYEATILDLKHVNQSYEKMGLEPIDGILGGDILVDYKAVIDYEKKELVLKS